MYGGPSKSSKWGFETCQFADHKSSLLQLFFPVRGCELLGNSVPSFLPNPPSLSSSLGMSNPTPVLSSVGFVTVMSSIEAGLSVAPTVTGGSLVVLLAVRLLLLLLWQRCWLWGLRGGHQEVASEKSMQKTDLR